MNYQWYPGHMTKARRMMEENIKLIDLVIELVDARIPLSSRNPDIDGLAKNKARIILLNKSDLSDERKNVMWNDYFTKKGFYVLKLNSKSGAGVKQVNQTIVLACKEKIERDKRKGIFKPSGACNGRRYSECRKVDLYQCICRKSLRKDRE